MSELKEHLFVPYSELQEGDELTDAFTIAKSYYLKSEADKVIAYLEESHKKEVEQLLIENAELKKACNSKDNWCLHTLKENRHQKYKRCLAMARWCESDMEQWVEGSYRWERRKKWHKCWLELAEKFKEAK